MINRETFFNDHTLNIFTDASVGKYDNNSTESLAGCVVECNGELTHQNFIRIRDSTNNEGEIYAIYMGLSCAVVAKESNRFNKHTINLFSDSKISVFGLREWYNGWIRNSMNSDKLLNSSNEAVKNQDLFIKCINMIVRYELHINIYHVRGHINPLNHSDMSTFIRSFMKENKIFDDICENLVHKIAYYNNMVDKETRIRLMNDPHNEIYNTPTITISQKSSEYVNPAFLFSNSHLGLAKIQKRYTELVKMDDI